MTPDEQREEARKEIKIRMIENGFLVGAGGRWLSFPSWDATKAHLEGRVMSLMAKRGGRP
jgi:hypothetical protein